MKEQIEKILSNLRLKDVLEDMKSYPDFFFNTIFGDPPYNLGSEPFIDKDGLMKFKKAQDFMLKWTFDETQWDTFFQQAFRTLKYGGYCLLYGLDRQLPLVSYYAIKNGFEKMQSLYWYFISSFPKATDASKSIDKRLGEEREVVGNVRRWGNNAGKGRGGQYKNEYEASIVGNEKFDNITKPSSDLAKIFDGYKYSVAPFKQVLETIMVFRKPPQKTIIDDIFKWEENTNILSQIERQLKEEHGVENVEWE